MLLPTFLPSVVVRPAAMSASDADDFLLCDEVTLGKVIHDGALYSQRARRHPPISTPYFPLSIRSTEKNSEAQPTSEAKRIRHDFRLRECQAEPLPRGEPVPPRPQHRLPLRPRHLHRRGHRQLPLPHRRPQRARREPLPRDHGGRRRAAAHHRGDLVAVPGAQLHLVDPDRSLDLGAGTLSVVRLRQGDHSVAVLSRLVPEKPHRRRGLFRLFSSGRSGDGAEQEPVQWPLTRDVAAVKLDHAHYFSLHVPHTDHDEDKDDSEEADPDAALSYGLTVAGKGQEKVLGELDRILEEYTTFSVKQVEAAAKEKSEVMDARAVAEITPEQAVGDKKEVVEEQSAAFWTTIAPNVDDYSSSVARLIARGSGQLVRGIIWCGDITAEGLRRGEEVVKKSVGPSGKPAQVKPSTIRRMKRARRVTKMSNRLANSILSGVLKVTGFVTSTVLNSKPAQKFFKLMPGEVILASLDGFGKIWDAVEVSCKNVMQTSSVVTTSVVTHRYGEQAGEATHNYLHATGNVLGAAWAVFKIRKALDPKGNLKKSSMVSSAAHAVAKESIARQKK